MDMRQSIAPPKGHEPLSEARLSLACSYSVACSSRFLGMPRPTLGHYSISGRLEARAAAGKKGAHSKVSHTAVGLQCFAFEFVLRNVPYMVHFRRQ